MPNDAQRAVIEAPLAGPRVVDAGAGTGKTQTLALRVVRLCTTADLQERLAPGEILVVTFTRKAAGEIGQRLGAELRKHGIDETPTCTTFHALGYTIIREFAYLAGESPDVRAADDARIRTHVARAVDDLIAGRIDVSTKAFPLLGSVPATVNALVALTHVLRKRGLDADAFRERAIEASAALRAQPWGRLYKISEKTGKSVEFAPKTERSALERASEADAEEANVVVVHALVRRVETLLREAGDLTFVDQLNRAAEIARRPEVRAILHARWRHALVDEFQDSAEPQLALLRAICGDALERVLVVGDARQAIYGFTGAQPTVLRDFGRDAREMHRLRINYRSHAPILELAHAFRAISDDGLLTHGDEPLVAHRGGHPDAVRVELFADGGGEPRETLRAREAAAVAGEIAELLANGTEAGEIAVLLRARTHALAYAAALRDANVPFRLHGGAGFYDAPEVRDALAWLRLLRDPADVASLVRVLASPAIGIGDAALTRLAGASKAGLAALDAATVRDRAPETGEALARFTACAARLGPLVAGLPDAAVQAVVRECEINAARVALVPRDARRIAGNLAKLERIARAFVAGRSTPTLAEFLDEIDARVEDDREPEADDARDAVAIVTVHGAKGLEWDHVFLADVSPQTFPAQRRVEGASFAYHPHTGALAVSRLADGRKSLRSFMRQPHDPATGCMYGTGEETAAHEFEERRLAYVAFTRARKRLTITGIEARIGTSPKASPSKYFKELREIVAARGLASVVTVRTRPGTARDASAGDPFRAADLTPSPGTERPAATSGAPAEPRALAAPTRLSYSAIAVAHECPRRAFYHYTLQVPDLSEDASVGRDAGEETRRSHLPPHAARFGTLVHRALELHALARMRGEVCNAAEAANRACEEYAEDDAPLRARVARASARGIAALAAYVPIAAERPFDLAIAGTRVHGFIDLVARNAAGETCVIDYKTGTHATDTHALQLAVYRAALASDGPAAPSYLLRVNDAGAELERVDPVSDEELRSAIEQTLRVLSGTDCSPRPNAACGRCAYAGALCPEGEMHVRTGDRRPR